VYKQYKYINISDDNNNEQNGKATKSLSHNCPQIDISVDTQFTDNFTNFNERTKCCHRIQQHFAFKYWDAVARNAGGPYAPGVVATVRHLYMLMSLC